MRLKDLFERPALPTGRGTPNFNPDGTVAGPGQSARPGRITPAPGGARPAPGTTGGMPAAPTPAPGGARPTPRAPGGLPAAPAQSGARPSSRIPGQEVSGADAVRSGARGNQAFVSSLSGPGVTGSNLRRGSSGSDVSSMQQMLIDRGYDVGGTGADGKFGPKTAAAVKQFQQDFGLQADGIAGDQTMSALNRLGAKPAAAPAPSGGLPTRPGQDRSGPPVTLPTRPGQDRSGPPVTLPTRPGQDRSGPPVTLPTRPGQDRSGPPVTLPTRPGQDRSGPPVTLPTRPGQDRSGPPVTLPTRPGQNVSGPITGGLPTRPGQDVSGPRNRRRF
jgi:peptidoglycan hydrolase-like protein with peptidoglycan-binding domain